MIATDPKPNDQSTPGSSPGGQQEHPLRLRAARAMLLLALLILLVAIALAPAGAYAIVYVLFVIGAALAAASAWYGLSSRRAGASDGTALNQPASSPGPDAQAIRGAAELRTLAKEVAELRRLITRTEDEHLDFLTTVKGEIDVHQQVEREDSRLIKTLSRMAQTARAQADAILETMEDGIIVLDDQCTVVVMNHSAMRILETSTSWIGENILRCNHVLSELPDLVESEAFRATGGQKVLLADGKVVVASLSPIRAAPAPAWLLVLRDITIQAQMESEIVERNRDLEHAQEELAKRNEELKCANARLQELSVTDSLTGLPNTRKLHEAINVAIERYRRHGEGAALLLLDLDHFKEYNDAFGHLAGDAALQQAAAILRQSVRTLDTPARYGGEEFAVVLAHSDKAVAAKVAERIRRAVESYEFEHRKVTVCVGIATMPDDAEDERTLMALADKALYFAKQSGRNRVGMWEDGETRVYSEAA